MADSIIRKGDDLLELILDVRRSAQQIRVETSPDLATWTARVDLPSKRSVQSGTFRNKVFHEFVPSEYSLTFPFYVRFRAVTDGSAGDPGATYIAHFPSRGKLRHYTVTGTAPNTGTISGSEALVLPSATEIWMENTHGSNHLYVSFYPNGPEHHLPNSEAMNYEGLFTNLYIRSNGGSTEFELHYTTKH